MDEEAKEEFEAEMNRERAALQANARTIDAIKRGDEGALIELACSLLKELSGGKIDESLADADVLTPDDVRSGDASFLDLLDAMNHLRDDYQMALLNPVQARAADALAAVAQVGLDGSTPRELTRLGEALHAYSAECLRPSQATVSRRGVAKRVAKSETRIAEARAIASEMAARGSRLLDIEHALIEKFWPGCPAEKYANRLKTIRNWGIKELRK